MAASMLLLLLIAAFVGIVVWVFRRDRKARFATRYGQTATARAPAATADSSTPRKRCAVESTRASAKSVQHRNERDAQKGTLRAVECATG
jgi:uncharacterized protein HemX